MTTPTFTDLAAYQGAVLDTIRLLAPPRVTAQGWHSGGGINGLLIEAGDITLFSTLAADDDQAWTFFDLCDTDGRFLACVELQERPWGCTYTVTSTVDRSGSVRSPLLIADDAVEATSTVRYRPQPASPNEMALAIVGLAERFARSAYVITDEQAAVLRGQATMLKDGEQEVDADNRFAFENDDALDVAHGAIDLARTITGCGPALRED